MSPLQRTFWWRVWRRCSPTSKEVVVMVVVVKGRRRPTKWRGLAEGSVVAVVPAERWAVGKGLCATAMTASDAALASWSCHETFYGKEAAPGGTPPLMTTSIGGIVDPLSVVLLRRSISERHTITTDSSAHRRPSLPCSPTALLLM